MYFSIAMFWVSVFGLVGILMTIIHGLAVALVVRINAFGEEF
jgi:hypothetical protein